MKLDTPTTIHIYEETAAQTGFRGKDVLIAQRIMNKTGICSSIARCNSEKELWEMFQNRLHTIAAIYLDPGRRLEWLLRNELSKFNSLTSLTTDTVDRIYQYDLLLPSWTGEYTLWIQITTNAKNEKKDNFFQKAKNTTNYRKSWSLVLPVYIFIKWGVNDALTNISWIAAEINSEISKLQKWTFIRGWMKSDTANSWKTERGGSIKIDGKKITIWVNDWFCEQNIWRPYINADQSADKWYN